MKKRLIDAWLGFRGIVTVEAVAEAQAQERAMTEQATAIGRMLHQQDEKLYLITQEIDEGRRRRMLAAIVEDVTARRVKESNRIAGILIPELERTYGRDEDQIQEARRIGRRV